MYEMFSTAPQRLHVPRMRLANLLTSRCPINAGSLSLTQILLLTVSFPRGCGWILVDILTSYNPYYLEWDLSRFGPQLLMLIKHTLVMICGTVTIVHSDFGYERQLELGGDCYLPSRYYGHFLITLDS